MGDASDSTSPEQYFAEKWPMRTVLGRFPSWFEQGLAREKRVHGHSPASPAPRSSIRTSLTAWRVRLCSMLVKNESARPTPPQPSCDWCEALGLDSPIARRAEELLADHYNWADQLAIHYASQFRAVGHLRHLLMAVVMVGVLIGSYVKYLDTVGFGIETAAFGGILFLVWVNNAHNWHQRFLDDRFLAEQLRHMRFLFMLGRVPAFTHESADPVCTCDSWLAWHLRNVARHAGLICLKMTTNMLKSYQLQLDTEVIQGQIGYYQNKHVSYNKIAQFLNTIGTWCFVAGLLFICSRFLIFSWVKDNTLLTLGIEGGSLRTLLDAVALVIPAIASMAFAIRAQGEYTTLSSRYAHTQRALTLKSQQLRTMGLLTSAKLADFSEKLANFMAGEVIGWHTLVRRKSLSPHS